MENTISFNIVNIITITLMAMIGYVVFATVVQLAKQSGAPFLNGSSSATMSAQGGAA